MVSEIDELVEAYRRGYAEGYDEGFKEGQQNPVKWER
jgi:flagellar biosynthesis/type III secretory pathway protein FliH